jgi:hypothetical protein
MNTEFEQIVARHQSEIAQRIGNLNQCVAATGALLQTPPSPNASADVQQATVGKVIAALERQRSAAAALGSAIDVSLAEQIEHFRQLSTQSDHGQSRC